MKVGELKKLLAKHDDDLNVYMATDPEGNNYWDLEDVALGRYDGYGGMYLPYTELMEELEDSGFSVDDLNPDAELCLVLWP